jgi:peptidoglycan/xylan/chitin deacetylase (PgdA/CDA1 family)
MNKFSRSDNYIIINYHYIRNHSDKLRGINSCSIKEFDRQIRFLSENFKIVSIPDVFKSVVEKINGKFCAISFDDCFKDIYTNAFPVLKKYNVTASIFLISSVLEGKLPSANKLHILLSKFSASELIDKFNNLFSGKRFIPKNRRIYKKKRLDDDILTANLKETLILIPPNLKDNFINSVFDDLNLDESEIIKDFFMSIEEIRKLCDFGFILGNHSYSHNNLSSLKVLDIEEDIKKSKRIMRDFFGGIGGSDIFSYPSGRWNKKVLGILSKEKFKYGLTIHEKPISYKDNPLLIPRYDTNNLRDFLDTEYKKNNNF